MVTWSFLSLCRGCYCGARAERRNRHRFLPLLLCRKLAYVFGLARKSRTAILRCYSVVNGLERALAIGPRREHEVDFFWIEFRMLLPEKIPLGDWLAECRAVLHVDLPVVFRYLVQIVVPLDLIHDLAHVPQARFDIFARTVIGFTSIRPAHCFKRVGVHCCSFPTVREQLGREREPFPAS